MAATTANRGASAGGKPSQRDTSRWHPYEHQKHASTRTVSHPISPPRTNPISANVSPFTPPASRTSSTVSTSSTCVETVTPPSSCLNSTKPTPAHTLRTISSFSASSTDFSRREKLLSKEEKTRYAHHLVGGRYSSGPYGSSSGLWSLCWAPRTSRW
ncbi:hypothetical protein BOTBODRAFT_178451 [Botryobasidium botryosum FD-172 SS1]|uniref:Uncharacterized protein n=1 Tax=Botryobasidium botryosum (strain FD-172 SS1) TaxID=930990 RepID=A0A067M2R7_BOTB1|nr:hypothetical protein BOTBODRAFT_178451 [Botryobasidium botryosum FD-172 SS1]